jgi:hypothetical protein
LKSVERQILPDSKRRDRREKPKGLLSNRGGSKRRLMLSCSEISSIKRKETKRKNWL